MVLTPATAGERSCFALPGDLLSFASPKRNVSKGDPIPASRLKPGNLGCLKSLGSCSNSLTLRQSQALNPETAALLGALNGKKVKSQVLSSRNGN